MKRGMYSPFWGCHLPLGLAGGGVGGRPEVLPVLIPAAANAFWGMAAIATVRSGVFDSVSSVDVVPEGRAACAGPAIRRAESSVWVTTEV